MNGRKLVLFMAVWTVACLVAAMLNSSSILKVKPNIKLSISTWQLPWKWAGFDQDHSKNDSSTMLEADKGNLNNGAGSDNDSSSADTNKYPFSAGVVLSDSYADQVTTAISNMMDLQCWAGQFNVSVVEPFLSGSHFKTGPTPSRLKFSNIFNKSYWNAFCEKHHFAPLVHWKQFLNFAPRSIILAHVTTLDSNKSCAVGYLKAQWSPLFQRYGFKVIKEACIEMRKTGPLTTKQFSSLVFGKHSPQNVTLLFHNWRGIRRAAPLQRIILKDTTCSGTLRTNYTTSLTRAKLDEDGILLPSQEILKLVEAYTQRYLHSGEYIAVMLRMERIYMKKGVRDYSTNITTCIVKIISLWREMVQESGVEATFISTDIGKYGSSGIRMSKQVPEDASKLFHAIKNSTLQNYDKTFAAVTGENSNEKGYISVLQKALASRAKCLLLVGGGSYQAHTLHLYKQLHPKEQCVKIIDSRNQCVQ